MTQQLGTCTTQQDAGGAQINHVLDCPLLTLREVSQKLAVSTRTIEREIKAGRLSPIWVRGSRRFRSADVEAYLQRCRTNT